MTAIGHDEFSPTSWGALLITVFAGLNPVLLHQVRNKIMWHEGYGYIKYDPPRPGMKRRTDWWAIVKIDREITRYYRWWVKKEKWIDLCQPSWDAHISIIRGEKPWPDVMHLWKKYDGQRIDFKYKHHVRQSGDTTGGDRPDNYWFIEIDCPKLIEIRKEFGLPCDWKLHLTIGRTWY